MQLHISWVPGKLGVYYIKYVNCKASFQSHLVLLDTGDS